MLHAKPALHASTTLHVLEMETSAISGVGNQKLWMCLMQEGIVECTSLLMGLKALKAILMFATKGLPAITYHH
jgi:hypothetical protein